MSVKTKVTSLPMCDICKAKKAAFDGKTQFGPWANMCSICFGQYGIGLGTGKGQHMILVPAKKKKVTA